MVYYRRRRSGKSYRKRYSRRYRRRRTRYPRTTRARATKALRRTYKTSGSLYRLKKKLDFQRYYNWNSSNYTLDFSNVGPFTLQTTTGDNITQYYGNGRCFTSANVMPYWIRGTTTSTQPYIFQNTYLSTGNEGVKPGQATTKFGYPTIQGGRMRTKSVYCRWNFMYVDNLDANQQDEPNTEGKYSSVKVRLCVFTLYSSDGTNIYQAPNTIVTSNAGNTPINNDNSNGYFPQSYFNTTQTWFKPPTMVMKNVGSSRLHKVYDKTFTLNRLKTSKTVKVNLYKGSLFKFDVDYVPDTPAANARLHQFPFQQIFFCVMCDNSYYSDGGDLRQQAGMLLVNNQNVVIYYDT